MKIDDEESSEDQKKIGYLEGLVNCLFNRPYSIQLNDAEDLASHWTLKLAFANESKGDFVMYESQLFSAKLH